MQAPSGHHQVASWTSSCLSDCMQAKEWSANDEVKVHKSRLEREKEAAAAARQEPPGIS